MESHKLIALQTAKHDGLYLLLSVSLAVPPFQQRYNPCRIDFYTLAFLFFFLLIP